MELEGYRELEERLKIEDVEITSLQDIQQAVDLNKQQHKRIYILKLSDDF